MVQTRDVNGADCPYPNRTPTAKVLLHSQTKPEAGQELFPSTKNIGMPLDLIPVQTRSGQVLHF